MKRTRLGWVALMVMAAGQAAAADVGVSISIGEPGFYGRLDIGNFPRPQLVYARPLVIQPVREVVYEPVYLRVPPAHARDWRKHCHHYGMCGHPVYFVQDRWYNDVYVPRYRERHGERDERRGERDERNGRGHDKGHGKGRDKD